MKTLTASKDGQIGFQGYKTMLGNTTILFKKRRNKTEMGQSRNQRNVFLSAKEGEISGDEEDGFVALIL